MKKLRRNLDNTAKAFSLEEKRSKNTFRLSVFLKENINPEILELALKKSLKTYPSYKVKIKSGLLWNFLEYNPDEPIIEEENQTQYQSINDKKNNGYLFKVTYLNNKINLDVTHVLTDGVGASILLKEILYNYLNEKYNLIPIKEDKIKNMISTEDEYIKNVDKKINYTGKTKKSYLIQEKINKLHSQTHHYILDLKHLKSICKNENVSITEYLTTLYIYALYKSIYDKNSNKDITITLPIDLRKYYQVDSFSNFFTSVNIEGNIENNKNITFPQMLKHVNKEFKSKLTNDKIKQYLARDVKLGTNPAIHIVPLCGKKIFMKYFAKLASNSSTTTLSNLGPIKLEEQYQKYIDNIIVIARAGKIQKIKCTICSYENNLTITVNSNLTNNHFEKEFHKLLKKHIGKVKLENNMN